jgi:hypothetical protein
MYTMTNNLVSTVNVTFDFDEGLATLEGLGSPIQNNICLVSARLDQWWKIGCVEFYIDDEVKWSFIWEEWANHEQFFGLDKYAKPAYGRPGDVGYNPWSKLAKWSYIPKPGKGTMQKNHIYKNYYHAHLFPEIQEVAFTIKGNPNGDWTTADATEEGYWY